MKLSFLAALAAASLMAACGPVVERPTTLADFQAQPSPVSEYRIATGDELDIRLFYIPELSQPALVRPDGKITLPLIGDIQAAGLTPENLSAEIERLYGQRFDRPDASVAVRGSAGQRVFVGGEVRRPGIQPLTGSMSVLQAIIAAEGVMETGTTEEVVIVRRTPDGATKVIPVNIAQAISGRDTGQDIQLAAQDVVLVPRSDVANVNLWIDQYIRRNLPVDAGVFYSFGRDR